MRRMFRKAIPSSQVMAVKNGIRDPVTIEVFVRDMSKKT